MGNFTLSDYWDKTTRRSFLKGLTAIGAALSAYGCGSDSEDGYYSSTVSSQRENIVADIKSGVAEVWAGTAGHNCGGRCVTRAVKKNGKIVRILTDETYITAENEDHVSNAQSRACSRCRSYVGRLYHPGRMKYPLKQTKQRGDLSGFVRITWEEAMMEVAKKYAAIAGKYGEEAIYNHMSSGQQGPFNRAGGASSSSQFAARVGPLSGGYLHHANSYSSHQSGYFGTGFTGVQNTSTNAQSISTATSTLMMWGVHSLATSNSVAFGTIKAAEDLKARGGKVYHINPSLEDTGITLATDWIQIRAGTDVALILALIYEMLVNSFNANGTPKSKADAWLDIDYIDTMVYGFFDSPDYWIRMSDGDIQLSDPGADYTKVNAVSAGKSLASYILGSAGLPNAVYGAQIDGAVNYTSGKFTGINRAAGCSWTTAAKAGSTNYYYKKDILKAKNPAWAQEITGVPAATITALARHLSDEMKAENAVFHHSSNGWQRRADGVYALFALQSLAIITKAWGKIGSGYTSNASISPAYTSNGSNISVNTTPELGNTTSYSNNVPKIPSCTIWHDGVKFGYDIPGYTGAYIPGYTPGKGKSFIDDSNVKSLIKHKLAYTDLNTKLSQNANTRYTIVSLPDANGVNRDYFDWEGRENNTFTPVGIRFIFTMAGNAIINQHMNANDTAEMLSKLPVISADAPNVADCFCYVALDTNFSPTMRWADYAFPGAANWECVDLVSGSGGAQQIYMPAAINPPGEAKSGYEMTRLLSRCLGIVDNTKYGRLAAQFDNGMTPDDYIRTGFDKAKAADAAGGPYSKWNSFEEYQKSGYIIRKHSTSTTNPGGTLYGRYTAHAGGDISLPFIKTGQTITTNRGSSYRTSSGSPYSGYMVDTNDPLPSGRFHVYSGMLVWEYEHRNEKFHGYLPPAERGNKNADGEGDPIAYPIPIYFDNRDYYKEAYGTDMFNAAEEAAKPLYVLGTHNRFRSHSTFNDSPLMRELGKAAIGGGIPLDTQDFSNVINSSSSYNQGDSVPIRRLGTYDNKFGYERLWLNPEDAAARNINNGDLVVGENPVGKIRAVAAVSPRVAKGNAVLPQGGWYDPNPSDGIDDGGCANTICASLPSRVDHGNAQMSALLKVYKA